jgi:hypothetical protein
MTQIPVESTSHDKLPPSAEQHLLQQLITEGLTSSIDQDTDVDIIRYRRLIEVLVQECLVVPDISFPSSTALDHARLTLVILETQSRARPNVLFHCPAKDSRVPLFKQILPKLIQTGARYSTSPQAQDFVDHVCSAVVNLIFSLARGVGDEQTTYARGARRIVLVISHLIDFVQGKPVHVCGLILDVLDDRASELYMYPALPKTLAVILCILSAVLACRPVLGDHINIRAELLFARLGPLITSPVLQMRYVATLAVCFKATSSGSTLARAMNTAVQWSVTTNSMLRDNLHSVLEAVTLADQATQLNVWWAIQDHTQSLGVVDHSELIEFLLSPVNDRDLSEKFEPFLSTDLLTRWREEAMKAGKDGEPVLNKLDKYRSTSYNKRKRSGDDLIATILREASLIVREEDNPLDALLLTARS